MNSGKKHQKKRKRQSPLTFKSEISRRLEKLRGSYRDLWNYDDDDDDDDDDDYEKPRKQSKITHPIVLSDSDEERPSTSSVKKRSRNDKFQNHHENKNKNATCLICSIISRLSSHNCCSNHLSILKNPSQLINSHLTSEQVMIVPLTHDFVQRYLDPEQIEHFRTQMSISPRKKRSDERKPSVRTKSTMTVDPSEIRQTKKNTRKSTTKSSQIDIPPIASTIVIGSARSNSTTIDLSSSPKSRKTIETNQTHETIVVDDDPQPINEKESVTTKPKDPWTAVSDETDTALEKVLQSVDASTDSQLEFTPTTVRRTETEIMAACLPKLPLKEGRFRLGRPINSRSTSNAANEYRPLAAAQTTSVTTSSAITINAQSPSNENNLREESSKTENPIDYRKNNEDNNLYTQDEPTSEELVPKRTAISEISTSNAVTNDNSHTNTNTNQLNSTVVSNSSTIYERTTTASRISIRLNPDGTQVSISRPPLLNSLRRTSTDVTPIQHNTKQM